MQASKKGQAANFFLQGNPAGLLNVVLGLRGAAVGIEPGCPQGETCIAPRAAQATLGARVKPLGQTGCAADYRRKPGHRPKTKTKNQSSTSGNRGRN